MINILFSDMIKKDNFKNNFFKLSKLSIDFSFFYNIIKSLINYKFFSKDNKIILFEIKNILIKIKKI